MTSVYMRQRSVHKCSTPKTLGVCRRETHCDFCSATLPDWRAALTPATGADAPAVMNVTFDGVAYSFNVRPGPEGYEDFAAQVR